MSHAVDPFDFREQFAEVRAHARPIQPTVPGIKAQQNGNWQTGWPLATSAFYGSGDIMAIKLNAGVVPSEVGLD